MSRQPRSEIFYADRYISSADGISEEEVCEEEERHVQERVERRGEERRPQRERSASRDRGTAEVSEDDRTDRPRRKRTVSSKGYSNTKAGRERLAKEAAKMDGFWEAFSRRSSSGRSRSRGRSREHNDRRRSRSHSPERSSNRSRSDRGRSPHSRSPSRRSHHRQDSPATHCASAVQGPTASVGHIVVPPDELEFTMEHYKGNAAADTRATYVPMSIPLASTFSDLVSKAREQFDLHPSLCVTFRFEGNTRTFDVLGEDSWRAVKKRIKDPDDLLRVIGKAPGGVLGLKVLKYKITTLACYKPL